MADIRTTTTRTTTTIDHSDHTVISRRRLSETTFVLRFDRARLPFRAGQHIHVGLAGSNDLREYSVYSGTGDPYLEILVREIDDGLVSRQLGGVEPGDQLRVEGPYGFFTIKDGLVREPGLDESALMPKYWFIATGTGIAPFRSIVKSMMSSPGARTFDYRLLHGIRYASDVFEYDVFSPDRVVRCVSRDRTAGTYQGRVTDYLRENPPGPGAKCYLCGNCDMIYDAFDMLRALGIESRDLYSEVYF